MEKSILQYHRNGGSRRRSWHGCQQKAISVKLDNNVSDMVDSEIRAMGVSRNALINMSLKWYLEELDEARRLSAAYPPGKKYILNVDVKDLTGEELKNLEFISRSMGCTMETIALNAIKVMLREYNQSPIRWMP
jgi:hypothetical protein